MPTSLQNSEQGATQCKEYFLKQDSILQKYYLHCFAPCSELCRDGLMMVS